jgi:hypothetical protein
MLSEKAATSAAGPPANRPERETTVPEREGPAFVFFFFFIRRAESAVLGAKCQQGNPADHRRLIDVDTLSAPRRR